MYSPYQLPGLMDSGPGWIFLYGWLTNTSQLKMDNRERKGGQEEKVERDRERGEMAGGRKEQGWEAKR